MATGSQLTLGAKLTILPHPFVRKSALTTPPIRVPNNSRLLLSNTAALSSKRTDRPSGLRTGFLLRTMTARRTSPRRTLSTLETACWPGEMGRARFTTQTISSPTLPQPLLTLFLSTLTHSTSRAPELSITCFFGGIELEVMSGRRVTHVEGALEANHRLDWSFVGVEKVVRANFRQRKGDGRAPMNSHG